MKTLSGKGLIPPGCLTLLCEGNNNPFSINWSRRLRISSKGHAVVGKGYNLATNTERQAMLDLTEAGIPKLKAQLFIKARSLNRIDAGKFIAFYKNDVVLTKEQEKKLFDIQYKRTQDLLKTKVETYTGKSDYYNVTEIPQYQWEILVDMLYCGDINSENEKHIFSFVKKALTEHHPQTFNDLVLDVSYWRQQEVAEDRIKMRCIFLNEWKNFADLPYLPSQEIPEEEGPVQMLTKFPDLFSIEGLYINYKQDSLHLLIKKMVNHPNVKKVAMIPGISMEQLTIALKLSYDKSIDSSRLGGTLEPLDPYNPEDRRLKKEFFPDKSNRKQIISGTKFAEIILEASKIITEIACGSSIVDRGNYLEKVGEYGHMQAFKELGIFPLENQVLVEKETTPRSFTRTFSTPKLKTLTDICLHAPKNSNLPPLEKKENKMFKFWLVVRDIKLQNPLTKDGEFFGVPKVELGLKPYRIWFNPQGLWEESLIDDREDPAYMFAQRFSEKYSLIAKLFPVFKQVEQMYKAILLANWMMLKGIPVDMVAVNNYYQKGLQYISSPRKAVFIEQNPPTPVVGKKEPVTPKKSPRIFMAPPEKRRVPSLNTLTELSFSSVSKQLSARGPGPNWPELNLNQVKRINASTIFGGVLLDVNSARLLKNEGSLQHLLENQVKQSEQTLEAIFNETFEIEYPFQDTMCQVCENYLKYSEIKNVVNGNYYCRLHHPFSCSHCYNIIQSNCLDVEGKKYHSGCIYCKFCGKNITGKLVKIPEGFLHVKCSEEFLKDWQELTPRTKKEKSPVILSE